MPGKESTKYFIVFVRKKIKNAPKKSLAMPSRVKFFTLKESGTCNTKQGSIKVLTRYLKISSFIIVTSSELKLIVSKTEITVFFLIELQHFCKRQF